MAVAAFQGPHDQGVYGLVSSLGSIVGTQGFPTRVSKGGSMCKEHVCTTRYLRGTKGAGGSVHQPRPASQRTPPCPAHPVPPCLPAVRTLFQPLEEAAFVAFSKGQGALQAA